MPDPSSDERRTALVTGGNRGIGFEVCRLLARRGLRILLGSRVRANGKDAARRLQRQGGDVQAVAVDVTDASSLKALQHRVKRMWGTVDVLVNNAGIYLDEGVSVFDVKEDVVRATQEVNVYGPLRLCRVFVPGMQQRGYGRVVNVSSGYGSLNEMRGRTAAYRISKAALNALTRIVADEVDGRRVKVNAVCPGWVRTEMGGRSAPRSPRQAAKGIVWAATLPKDGPTGGLYRDGRPLPW